MSKNDQMHEAMYIPGTNSLQELPAHIVIAEEIDRGIAVNHHKGNMMNTTIEEKLAIAVAAAAEFKYMLDIQPSGTLYFPGRKKIDPRDSFCYKTASDALLNLLSDMDDRSMCPARVLLDALAISDLVPDHSGKGPAQPLDILAEVHILLTKFGIEVVRKDSNSSKDCRLLILGPSLFGSLEKIGELGKRDSGIVHKSS